MKRLLITVFILFYVVLLHAQKLQVGYIFPNGGQKGTTFEITVGGQGFYNVTGIVVSGAGVSGTIKGKPIIGLKSKAKAKTQKLTDQDNDQLADKVIVAIKIAANAMPGIRDFRLITPNGYSNRIFFEVGQFSDILEKEPNEKDTNATFISQLPACLNGQIMPGDRDRFSFRASKGQNLVCYVKARTLTPYIADAVPGWFQSVITLYDQDGKEVAFCDDYKLQPDPVILYKVLKTGKYYLEIRDAIYRGREDFIYRIDIGEIPFVTSCYPLGGKSDQMTKLTLDGVNLKRNTVRIRIPKDGAEKFTTQIEGKNKMLTNPIILANGSFSETFHDNKMNLEKTAQKLEIGTTVNSKINQPRDEDWYAFNATKGMDILLKIVAHNVGSPIDADITVYDDKKNKLTQNDDKPDRSEPLITRHSDPELIFHTPKDGLYLVRIRDVQQKGDNSFAYRLTISQPLPDFSLRIEPSNIMIPKGGTELFTVFAIRKNNFNDSINLFLEGLPPNFKHSWCNIPRGAERIRVSLTAPDNADSGEIPLKIIGTINQKGIEKKVEAEPSEEAMQAFFYTHLLTTSSFLVNVSQQLPFSISIKKTVDAPILVKRNDSLKIDLTIKRQSDCTLPIQLILDKPINGVKMKPVLIPDGVSDTSVIVQINNIAPNQHFHVAFIGTGKYKQGQKQSPIKAYTQVINLLSSNEKGEKVNYPKK